MQNKSYKFSWLETKLGSMLAIADDEKLYLLEFAERKHLQPRIELFKQKNKASIMEGRSQPIITIENELNQYFAGKLTEFNTSFALCGTTFQQRVWQELIKIPYGETCSYADQARSLGQPTAFRAVANANGSNSLAIVIPCHRVINSSGELGGYAAGLDRKRWLLAHEKTCAIRGRPIADLVPRENAVVRDAQAAIENIQNIDKISGVSKKIITDWIRKGR